MAKTTLADIKKCPIDFLYLWASDAFIAELGSKARIVKEKRYYQQQSLYRAVSDNVKASDSAELMKYYEQWADDIAKEIYNTYNLTPGQILIKLALGEDVAGKNFKSGVFGVGGSSDSFVQNSQYTVNPVTGQVMYNGMALPGQTAIYDQNGQVSGFSYTGSNGQFQSVYGGGTYSAFSFSNDAGVQTADGKALSSDKCGFWQNANNYMPMVDKILTWLMSVVNNFFPNRTIITPQNTVPSQSEWVEEDGGNTGLWIAGGAVLAGLLLTMRKPTKTKSKKSKE